MSYDGERVPPFTLINDLDLSWFRSAAPFRRGGRHILPAPRIGIAAGNQALEPMNSVWRSEPDFFCGESRRAPFNPGSPTSPPRCVREPSNFLSRSGRCECWSPEPTAISARSSVRCCARAVMSVAGLDCGFYRNGLLYDDGLARPEHHHERHPPYHRLGTSRDTTRWFISRNCRTIRWASMIRARPSRSITRGRSARTNAAARPASRASSIPRRAASTAPAPRRALTERSATYPQTAYARCKVLVEHDVGQLACEGVHAGFPAQCHGVRAEPAHALRHRPQQPRR